MREGFSSMLEDGYEDLKGLVVMHFMMFMRKRFFDEDDYASSSSSSSSPSPSSSSEKSKYKIIITFYKLSILYWTIQFSYSVLV